MSHVVPPAFAAKLIATEGIEPLVGRLLLYDGRAARFTELSYEGAEQA